MKITFTLAQYGVPNSVPNTVCVEMTEALSLNLISVARQVDALVEWDHDCDTFEKEMVAALDGDSARRIDSVLAEMQSWAEDEDHLVVWDRDERRFAICPDPASLTVTKEGTK